MISAAFSGVKSSSLMQKGGMHTSHLLYDTSDRAHQPQPYIFQQVSTPSSKH